MRKQTARNHNRKTLLNRMKLKKHIRLVIGFLAIGFVANSQDTLNLVGVPDFSFHGSTTNRIDSTLRIQIEGSFPKFKDLQEPIVEYLEAGNSGNDSLAQIILEEKLENQNEFGLQMGYMLFRMHQLDILYLPMFQVHNPEEQESIESDRILVSCTIEQYEQLKLIRGSNEFVCAYIGEMHVDKAKVYKLIEIKSH